MNESTLHAVQLALKVLIAVIALNASVSFATNVDTDSDGLPDIWEQFYGFDALVSADACMRPERP